MNARSLVLAVALPLLVTAAGCNALLDIGDAFLVGGEDASADRGAIGDGNEISPSAISIGPFAEARTTRGKTIDLAVAIAGDRGIYGRLVLKLASSLDGVRANDVSVEPGQTTATFPITVAGHDAQDAIFARLATSVVRIELRDGEKVVASSDLSIVVEPRSGDVDEYGVIPNNGSDCNGGFVTEADVGFAASFENVGSNGWRTFVRFAGRVASFEEDLRTGTHPAPIPVVAGRGNPASPSVALFQYADGGEDFVTLHRFLPDGGRVSSFGTGGIVDAGLMPSNGLDVGVHVAPNGATWLTNGSSAFHFEATGAPAGSALLGFDRKLCDVSANGDLVCVARANADGSPRLVRATSAGVVDDRPLGGVSAVVSAEFEPRSVLRLTDGSMGVVVKHSGSSATTVVRVDVADAQATATMVLAETPGVVTLRRDASVLAAVLDTANGLFHVRRHVFGASAPVLDVVPLLPGGSSVRAAYTGQGDHLFVVVDRAGTCVLHRLYP